MIPVHVGGYMMDVEKVHEFAAAHRLWVIEDAAHAFPSAWRPGPNSDWRMCGENTAAVTCFSFYANKTITTGEGGMAVTDDPAVAESIRLMSLHGLSTRCLGPIFGGGGWDYRIVQPGYKYNLTDIAAAIGCHQLRRAEEMRKQREAVAEFYLASLAEVNELSLPISDEDRLHSWHLFPIRLRLDCLAIDRNEFMEELKRQRSGLLRPLAAASPASTLQRAARLERKSPPVRHSTLAGVDKLTDFLFDVLRGNGPRCRNGKETMLRA